MEEKCFGDFVMVDSRWNGQIIGGTSFVVDTTG